MLPYQAKFDCALESNLIKIILYIKEATEENDNEIGKIELEFDIDSKELIKKYPLNLMSHMLKIKKTEINFFLKITIDE